MPMSPRTLRPSQALFHPEAQDWRNRAIANSGSVSGSTLKAVSDFCRQIDAAGIRDRFYRLNLFCGGNLNAALVPLFRGASRTGTQLGNQTDTNTNFVSGDYAETGASGGLVGNGNSKYLDTGLANSAMPSGNAHLSSYEIVRATTTFDTSIGARETNATGVLLLGSWSVIANYVFSGFESGGTITDSSGGTGHFLGSVDGATSSALFRNGSSIATSASTTRTPTNRNIYVFALNTGGVIGQYSNAKIGGYSIGLSMTTSQVSAFYTAMQTFQTALGRNA